MQLKDLLSPLSQSSHLFIQTDQSTSKNIKTNLSYFQYIMQITETLPSNFPS